jgi:hypothetical protein
MRVAAEQSFDSEDAIVLAEAGSEDGFGNAAKAITSQIGRWTLSHSQQAEVAAQTVEATFAERVQGWRERAAATGNGGRGITGESWPEPCSLSSCSTCRGTERMGRRRRSVEMAGRQHHPTITGRSG